MIYQLTDKNVQTLFEIAKVNPKISEDDYQVLTNLISGAKLIFDGLSEYRGDFELAAAELDVMGVKSINDYSMEYSYIEMNANYDLSPDADKFWFNIVRDFRIGYMLRRLGGHLSDESITHGFINPTNEHFDIYHKARENYRAVSGTPVDGVTLNTIEGTLYLALDADGSVQTYIKRPTGHIDMMRK